MWVSKSLDRARRVLFGSPAAEPIPLAEAAPVDVPCDVVIAVGRSDLDRLMGALVASLDPHMARPDSPRRLEGALATAIQRVGGHGTPVVTRSPAGLYTPEYWQLRVDGADGPTRSALDRLTSGTRIS
ncbi:MAG TPA: hypothetical protein VH720_05935 [Candidatus Limnocylindrales bacterium]|jgi:hypothetical protein